MSVEARGRSGVLSRLFGDRVGTNAKMLAHPVDSDDVMVAICLQQGAVLEWGDFVNYLSTRMAHFMIPRYIRIVHELPKTPTQKVQKMLLRQEGVTADTFDRAQKNAKTS